jgi:hypothetical protein
VWDEELNGASSSVTWNADNYVDLVCAGTSGDFAIRQTKMRFNYQAGKSLKVAETGVLFPEAGYIKRFGYFNTNSTTPFNSNRDGIYLESDGTTVYICLADNGTVTRVAQSSWNVDTFDGTGTSGVDIDWDLGVILVMDLEWLSLGDVRVGFQFNGRVHYAHIFKNTNTTVDPYMRFANHSLRYEIRGDGGAGTSTLREICGSVASEGGYEQTGQLYSADRGTTAFTTSNDTNLYPLISIRLRSGREHGNVLLDTAQAICTSTADFRWAIIMNPTVAGVDAASWVSVGNSSAVEYDISRDNTNTLSGGLQMASGYIRSTNQGGGLLSATLRSLLHPGVAIDGTADELVLAVQNLSNGAEDYYGSLNWSEPL